MKLKYFVLCCAIGSSALFAVAFKSFPVGLRFESGETGTVIMDVEGGCKCGREIINGSVSWRIPVTARHFKFVFDPRETPYRLKALTLFGIDAFPSAWLMQNVATTVPIYEIKPLLESESLELVAREDVCELDYRRFFDLLIILSRLAWICGMTLPIVILCIVWLLPKICSRLDSMRFFGISLLTAVIMSFPDPVCSFAPGLDESWMWMLNHLAFSKSFGNEVVFTYGPLGFLLYPEDGWGQILAALFANVIYFSWWSVLLLRVYCHSDNGRAMAWGLLLTMAFPLKTMEWRWVALAILSTSVPVYLDGVREKNFRVLSMALGGFLLILTSMMKFTSLTAVASTQLFCLIAFLRSESVGKKGVILAYVLAVLISFLVLFCLLFGSISSLFAWMKGSIVIASGYNLYMVVSKPYVELILPVGAIILTVVMCLFCAHIAWRDLLPFAIFLPFIFTTLKYAWVRQTPHALLYCLLLCFCFILFVSPRLMRRYVVLSTLFIICCFAIAAPYVIAGINPGARMLRLGFNPRGIFRTISLSEEILRVRSESVQRVTHDDIPDSWKSLIGDETVLFAPHELGPAMVAEKRFRIVPLPSMQLYSACHHYLDELDAEILNGNNHPDWVVCNVDVYWSGHFICYPRFWKTMFNVYEAVDYTDNYVLLRRRENPVSPMTFQSSNEAFIREGEWFDISKEIGTAISISWDMTPWGRFSAMFMRITPCYISIRHADGRECRFQMIPDNVDCQYPLDKVPVDNSEVVKVLCGKSISPVVAVRFDAETSGLYKEYIVLRMYR